MHDCEDEATTQIPKCDGKGNTNVVMASYISTKPDPMRLRTEQKKSEKSRIEIESIESEAVYLLRFLNKRRESERAQTFDYNIEAKMKYKKRLDVEKK